MPSISDTITNVAASSVGWAASSPVVRAALLTRVAEALDANVESLVRTACAETHLTSPRLVGELKRTTFQLRLLADEISTGAFFDVRIDLADVGWPSGPRPELRRYRTSVGPVLAFAASNFPFAFSVAGGDTASAWAAGCPVVVKAHPGHPELSRATAAVVTDAVRSAGAPEGVFALIEGREAGIEALRHPAIKAAAFTGSTEVGLMLARIAADRPEPIPFYGEFGGVNPVVVTSSADVARGSDIATGYAASLTLGAGQFCTNPGLIFVPDGSRLPERIAEALRDAPEAPMLTPSITSSYLSVASRLRNQPGVTPLVWPEDESALSPRLLLVDIATFVQNKSVLGQECFGPLGLVVTYRDTTRLATVISSLPGQLTTTLHAEPDDDHDIFMLMHALSDRSGRVLWGGWPTGVAVTPAMQHGGPYPATTNAATTSVGTAAIERFLRPISYQSWPEERLPEPLRTSNPWGVPQRVSRSAVDIAT